MEAIDNLYRTEDIKGLEPVCISIKDKARETGELFSMKGFILKGYADCGKSTKWAFKVNTTPSVYIINKEGKIIYRQIAEAGTEQLKKKIESYR